jgi:hypothetical protein
MTRNWDLTEFWRGNNGKFSLMRLATSAVVASACYVAIATAHSVTTAIDAGRTVEPAVIGNLTAMVLSMVSSALGFKAYQKGKEEPTKGPV